MQNSGFKQIKLQMEHKNTATGDYQYHKMEHIHL